MIFQASIDLEIENVQAVIDFDTGMVGFNKTSGGEVLEFDYFNSPQEYKTAFFKKLESLFSENNSVNMGISRKSKVAHLLMSFYQQ